METEQDDLELLIRHELAIKELYELFAGLFPDRQSFWRRIAGEEQRHGDFLQDLRSNKNTRDKALIDSRIKRLAIKGSIDYLARQLARIRGTTIRQVEALSIAKDLEDALIEKQLLRVADSAPDEVKTVMRHLIEETIQHRRIVSEALAGEKGQNR